MAEPEDVRRRRLLYQASRRGFKEADLLLGGFAASEVEKFDARQLDAFERLLSHSDHDIYAWALGHEPAPCAVAGDVLDRLMVFARK